jgi:aspartyl-tRNA(Asn)/glutamyl-tRNA(Gln) amidotransferase subunit C
MSKIGIDEVKRLAQLAKIGLTDEEAALMSVDLGQIMEFVEQLQKVDVANIEPTDQVTGLVDVFRPDEVRKQSISTDELLKNAPDRNGNYIKVKRVLG